MRRLRDPRGEAGRSKDPNTNSFSQKEKPTKIDATRIQRIDFFGPGSVSRDLDASGLRPAAVDPERTFELRCLLPHRKASTSAKRRCTSDAHSSLPACKFSGPAGAVDAADRRALGRRISGDIKKYLLRGRS